MNAKWNVEEQLSEYQPKHIMRKGKKIRKVRIEDPDNDKGKQFKNTRISELIEKKEQENA